MANAFLSILEHNNSSTSQVCVGYPDPCMCSCSSHDLALYCRPPSLPQLVVVGCSLCHCNGFCHSCWNLPHYLHWLAALTKHKMMYSMMSVACCIIYLRPTHSGLGICRSGQSFCMPMDARSGPHWTAAFAPLISSIEEKKNWFYAYLYFASLKISRKVTFNCLGGSLKHTILLPDL